MQLGEVVKEFEQPAPSPLNEPVPAEVPVDPTPKTQPEPAPLVPA